MSRYYGFSKHPNNMKDISLKRTSVYLRRVPINPFKQCRYIDAETGIDTLARRHFGTDTLDYNSKHLIRGQSINPLFTSSFATNWVGMTMEYLCDNLDCTKNTEASEW